MASAEHVQIVRQGAPAVARWREQHPSERLDLSSAILTNHNLNKADLSGADLSGADLVGARINQASLRRADLRDAASLMALLAGADLTESDLSRATLRRADLSGARLVGANLTGANLAGANLRGANLENAVLVGANFSEANLDSANLSGCDLNSASFSNSDLTGTDLRGAYLGKASFFRAVLSNTNFQRAAMFHTVFGDCDLSVPVGLDSVVHMGPSAVGVDTMFRSAGSIPEEFLRGVGVPEDLVVSYRCTVSSSPNPFTTCYLTYCAKDKAFARRLHSDLQASGLRCWDCPVEVRRGRWAGEGTPADELGIWIPDDVDRGIRYYDKLVAVCSEDALANEHLRDEITHGIQKQEETGRRVLFPVALSSSAYDPRNRYVRVLGLTRHVAFDFRGWEEYHIYEAALDGLVGELRQDQDASSGMILAKEEAG